MILLGYLPAFAQMISFGVQSAMRLASSCAENPPKTTTWVAPTRAHARIAMRLYMVMGM